MKMKIPANAHEYDPIDERNLKGIKFWTYEEAKPFIQELCNSGNEIYFLAKIPHPMSNSGHQFHIEWKEK